MGIIKIKGKEIELKGIIFDKDGTLIDFANFWVEMIKVRIAAILDHQIVKERNLSEKLKVYYPEFYGITKTNHILPGSILTQAGYDDSLIAAATVLYQHGIEWSKAKEIALYAYKLADTKLDYADYLKPLEGAIELVKDLHRSGIKIGLASMDTIQRSKYCLKLLNIHEYIPYIIGPEKTKTVKPDPEFVYTLCKEMNLKPNEIAVVGDGLNDILMGKNANVKCTIGVTTGVETYDRLEQMADFVVNSLNEIEVTKNKELSYQNTDYINMYTDGGAQGNPGPAGIGIVFKDNFDNTLLEISKFIGNTTNNYAEYQAIIIGLEQAIKLGYKYINIYSDSELIVKQIKGEYKVRQPDLQKLYLKVQNLLQNFLNYKITHIKRELNKRADYLVNQGIKNKILN